jgi:hypothetical protein
MIAYVDSICGAVVIMCALASLFFVRYWWLNRDRFFLWFAGAFVTFGQLGAARLRARDLRAHPVHLRGPTARIPSDPDRHPAG